MMKKATVNVRGAPIVAKIGRILQVRRVVQGKTPMKKARRTPMEVIDPRIDSMVNSQR